MARCFQMQNAYDKDHNKGVTETVSKIWIARKHCIGTPFTLKEIEKFCKLLSINHLKSHLTTQDQMDWRKALLMYLKEQLKR